MQTQQEQLDPDAVNLVKAIRQTESGGNFSARGKSGEYGAYQFTKPTWDSASKKYGVTANLEEATPEQQNEVAYKQIKEWKDKGFNVGQIASMWNAGEKHPDAYLQDYSGTNSYGVNYDTGKYAKSVALAYHKIKSGGSVGTDPNNPSSVSSVNPPQQNNTQAPAPKLLGSQTLGDLAVGGGRGLLGAVDTAASFGDWVGRQTVGRLGNYIAGNGFNPTPDRDVVAGTVGGRERLNALETPQNATQGVGKVMGETAAAALLGKGLGLFGSSTAEGGALSTNTAKEVVGDYAKSVGSKVSELSSKEIVNALENAASGADNLVDKKILQNATKEAMAKALKDAGYNVEELVSNNAGLLKRALSIKNLSKAGLAYEGIDMAKNALKALFEKYVGNQIESPTANNTMTIKAAP